jgi:hypothetical protein
MSWRSERSLFEEEDQLELEEDDRINCGPTDLGVRATHQFADEREVERAFEMAIEVIGRNKVVKRDPNRFVKSAGFRWSKHDRLRVGDG